MVIDEWCERFWGWIVWRGVSGRADEVGNVMMMEEEGGVGFGEV